MTKKVILKGSIDLNEPAEPGMYFQCTDNAVICLFIKHRDEYLMVNISNGDVYHDNLSDGLSILDIENRAYKFLNFSNIILEE